MSQTSKAQLFGIADPNQELKDVVFINRNIFGFGGLLLSISVSATLISLGELYLIASIAFIVLTMLLAVIPIGLDKQKEQYYEALLSTVEEQLKTFNIMLSRNQVITLIAIKSYQLDKEYLLYTEYIEGESKNDRQLKFFCSYTPTEDVVQTPRGKTFAVEVMEADVTKVES